MRRRWPLAAWGILAAAVAVRLPGIGKGLRGDEMGTVLYSGRSFGEITGAIVEGDAHPPLSYLVYHAWLWLGHGEAWIRLLTVGLGTALCATVFAIVRRRFDDRTSLAVMWLVAIAPSSVLLSQTVRSYMLGAAVFALAVLFVVRLQDEGTAMPWRLVVSYGLCTLVAIWTFYFVALPIAVLYAYGMWHWRRHGHALARWTAVHVAVALLYVPWLPMMARQLGHVSGHVSTLPGFFVGPVYLGGIARAAAGILGADDALFLERSMTALLPAPVLFAMAAIVLAIAGVFAVIGARAVAARGGGSFAGLVLALVAGPFVLAVVAHLTTGIVLLSRYFYVSFVFATIFAVAALGSLPSRRARIVALAVLSVICIVRDAQIYAWTEVDWKSAGEWIAPRMEAGDRVLHVSDARASYYMPRGLEVVDATRLLMSRSGTPQIDARAAAPLAERRLWLAVYATYLTRGYNEAVAAWIDRSGLRPVETRDFGSLHLTLYGPAGRREATR